ncbi:MAG: hypothetical protein V4493_09655 [Pseudomonadota bacterium]
MQREQLEARLDRIEKGLDRMGEAVTLLARIDERMLSHMDQSRRMAERQEKFEGRVQSLEISRGKFLGMVGMLSFGTSAIAALLVDKFK